MFRTARAAAAVLIGLFAGGAAIAGDRAELSVIGYSNDARFFAFEEFGIQDGSGAPYSSIYILDLSRDEWTPGSPFRVRPEDDTAQLADIRAEARAEAAAQLTELGTDHPATILALLGDGVPDADGTGANPPPPWASALAASSGKRLVFGQPGYTRPGEVYDSMRLQLQTFPADSPEPCTDYLGEKAKGFSLTLVGPGGPRQLHSDGRLPASRGCPVDYRLYAVLVPYESMDMAQAVVLVSVYPYGFEGPDRRFIAIPLGE